MIWEVDENLDNMIDFDELQLTYYRNINDTTGNEPCLFFRLLEVNSTCGHIHSQSVGLCKSVNPSFITLYVVYRLCCAPMQFLIFDGSNKGYIIEDDCMEILYARYGG